MNQVDRFRLTGVLEQTMMVPNSSILKGTIKILQAVQGIGEEWRLKKGRWKESEEVYTSHSWIETHDRGEATAEQLKAQQTIEYLEEVVRLMD